MSLTRRIPPTLFLLPGFAAVTTTTITITITKMLIMMMMLMPPCAPAASPVDEAADRADRANRADANTRGDLNADVDPDTLFKAALENYRTANYRRALELVARIESEKKPVKVRFGDENLHNFKGSCLTALRYFQHARKEFEKALATQPESFDMRYNLAEMDFLQEHFPEARAKFTELLSSTSRGRLYSEFLEFKILLCLLMEGETEAVRERVSDHGRHTPIRVFLDTALAVKGNQTDRAGLLLTLARAKVGEEDFALYEDSLIECGLLDPHQLSAEERRELDTAMRRPVSLGTDRTRPSEPAAASEPVPAEVLELPAEPDEPTNS